MLEKSECEAYKIGKKCREDALKKCPSKTEEEKIKKGIERDNIAISIYCK